MSYITMAPLGSRTVTLTAGQSIAVFTLGSVAVSQLTGYPNVPSTLSLLGTQVGVGQRVFGPFASGASVLVENGPTLSFISFGTAPICDLAYANQIQAAPVAVDVTGAVSATAILGGIVTSSTAAAVAGTIPTGAVMEASSLWGVNDSIDWSVINTGPNGFTVTAASGHTIVGAAVVATATSGRFRTRKSATDTFITYRVS